MHRLRFGLLVVAAALALGTGGALAMTGAVTTDPDSHGDAVASAARTTCPHGPGDAHGDCVSKIASAEGQENREGSREATIDACKAADVNEDKTEKNSSAHMTKAQKAADRKEDRTEHKNLVACITGHTAP